MEPIENTQTDRPHPEVAGEPQGERSAELALQTVVMTYVAAADMDEVPIFAHDLFGVKMLCTRPGHWESGFGVVGVAGLSLTFGGESAGASHVVPNVQWYKDGVSNEYGLGPDLQCCRVGVPSTKDNPFGYAARYSLLPLSRVCGCANRLFAPRDLMALICKITVPKGTSVHLEVVYCGCPRWGSPITVETVDVGGEEGRWYCAPLDLVSGRNLIPECSCFPVPLRDAVMNTYVEEPPVASAVGLPIGSAFPDFDQIMPSGVMDAVVGGLADMAVARRTGRGDDYEEEPDYYDPYDWVDPEASEYADSSDDAVPDLYEYTKESYNGA